MKEGKGGAVEGLKWSGHGEKKVASVQGKTFWKSKGSITTEVIINVIVINIINYKVKAIVS